MLPADFAAHLGKILVRLRKAGNISQYTLAERAGCSRKYIQYVENGRQEALVSTIFRLSEALGERPSVFIRMVEESIAESATEQPSGGAGDAS